MPTISVYKLNGQALDPRPTQGQWQPRRELGLNGQNQMLYAPTRQYALSWDSLSFTEFNALYAFYQAVASSGSVTADLPVFPGTTYDTFTTYSDCKLDEPKFGAFNQGQYTGVQLIIRNIVT